MCDISYYCEIKSFRSSFIDQLYPVKKYEIYKIWAQWLIRNLCKNKNNYHLIPLPEHIINDQDVLTHMKEKNISEQKIKVFYANLQNYNTYLYNKYNQSKSNQLNNREQISSLCQHISHNIIQNKNQIFHVFKLNNNIYAKYTKQIYENLVSRYIGPKELINFYLFELGFNYYILEGHSFQWCVPSNVFTVLKNKLSIDTEMFASPINVTLPHYYSLFAIDKLFGATDNFFSIDPSKIVEGTYEVNPPFIDYVFIESVKIIDKCLQLAHSNSKNLMFIYIMPNWTDSSAFQLLHNSPFLKDELILEEKHHIYHQSSKDSNIVSNFQTHVFVIASHQHAWTNELRQNIIDNFSSK